MHQENNFRIKKRESFESIKRKTIVKKEAETNPDYGILPQKRSVEELIRSGVIVIDKPQGPTSHQVADYVKKILNLKKAGHYPYMIRTLHGYDQDITCI